MKEYKMLCASPETIQKWLNQWRHEFELEILYTKAEAETAQNTPMVWVLLARTKKENF